MRRTYSPQIGLDELPVMQVTGATARRLRRQLRYVLTTTQVPVVHVGEDHNALADAEPTTSTYPIDGGSDLTIANENALLAFGDDSVKKFWGERILYFRAAFSKNAYCFRLFRSAVPMLMRIFLDENRFYPIGRGLTDGYSAMHFLSREAYQRYVKGEIGQFEFGPSDFLSPDEVAHDLWKFLYIQAAFDVRSLLRKPNEDWTPGAPQSERFIRNRDVGLTRGEALRDAEVGLGPSIFSKHALAHLQDLLRMTNTGPDDLDKITIFCETTTEFGKAIADAEGFRQIGVSKDKNTIYQIPTDSSALPARSRIARFIQILCKSLVTDSQ